MVRLEEQGCFQEAFPDNSQRPDISLYNNFHDTKKVVCDISFAHPYPIVGSKTLTKNQALQSMRASNLTFQKKNSKYKNISNDNSLEFRPLIFESTTGKFHKSTAEFFNKAIN